MYVAVANLQCFVPPKAATKNTGRNIKRVSKDFKSSTQSTTNDHKRKSKQPYFNNNETKGPSERKIRKQTKKNEYLKGPKRKREVEEEGNKIGISSSKSFGYTANNNNTKKEKKRHSLPPPPQGIGTLVATKLPYDVHNNSKRILMHS